MEKVQHDQSIVTVKFLKKCTRRVHKNAQTDNGPSVNGPLYTGGLHDMFSLIYNIRPPPNRLRSCLKTLYPQIRNWFIGNVLSSFDSAVRNKSKLFFVLSAKINLFLIELIFK